jgi:hypothetical protein|tara:strand:- start:47 stop:232 length:186 start_codon:yes stop_codon:yes gene_type:complete
MSKKKRYTIKITYETEIFTEMTPEEIEEGIWVGEHEIARYRTSLGEWNVRADATDIDIQEE